MPRPQPTHDYLNQAVDEPVRSVVPRRLLIVLDLNGTLLYRGSSSSPGRPRPHVESFLQYLLENHDVMVWTSAMPKNAEKMCRNIFTPDQYRKLLTIWTRADLRLGELINTAVKGHKRLTWVWHALNGKKQDRSWWYNQTNTVLIDDSRLKAAAEPWNLLEVREWDGHDMKDDILDRARDYIDKNLRRTQDVSQYLHKYPPLFGTHVPVTKAADMKMADPKMADKKTVDSKTADSKTADSLAEDIAMLDLSKGSVSSGKMDE